jgi:3-phosphoshikimate 1-carboxyvinyltransferase
VGVEVSSETDGDRVRFAVSGLPSRDASLDCGNSGTTMRLLAGAVAGLPLRATLDGDSSLRTRPMERVAELLRAAGAEVTTTDGHAPMTLAGRERLAAVAHRLPVASAQLLGAACLAGLAADGETVVESPGPTRDHTERILRAAGVPIHREGSTTVLRGPARPRPISTEVPGDISSAAAWLAVGALHPDAEITLAGIGLNPTRTAFVDLLQRAGADVRATVTGERAGEPFGDIEVRGGRPLQRIEVAGAEVAALIDELPLVGMLMAKTGGELRDASELRVKESDRVEAMVEGLAAIGASVKGRTDGWRVEPGTPRTARIATHGDHRIAIAFAIAAVSGVAASVELDDPGCVAVSYPGFWADLEKVAS